MSEIIVNPGTEKITEEISYENALRNMHTFLSELDIPYMIVSSKHIPDNYGYFEFIIKCIFYREITVNMPGLPLERVRYLKDKELNAFDFQRLYVDGSSWLWGFALDICGKEGIAAYIKEEIENLEYDIGKLKEKLQELEDFE